MYRALLIVALLAGGAAQAQDMPLSQILLPGEGWRELSRLESNPGAILADGQGRLLVAEADRPIVRVIDGDELVRAFWTPSGVVRAMCRDREGGILATIPARKRIVRFDGKKELTIEELDAQDVALIGGKLFHTRSAGGAIHLAGQAQSVAQGIAGPGGLVGWNDGSTLVVGEAGGKHLRAYRIGASGSLDGGERYYTLRVRPGKASEVRQLTLDEAGRLYAATAEGVQVFDPTGRLCGVLVSPRRAPVTGVALVGDRLYVICDGKLWWRKTKTRGV
ncbi:MAG: hypothetical protein U0840_25840 [Gemmataceae bacterium]